MQMPKEHLVLLPTVAGSAPDSSLVDLTRGKSVADSQRPLRSHPVSVPPEPQTVDERIDLSGNRSGCHSTPLATAAQLVLQGKYRHCCGLAAMPSSRVWKCPSIRVMVSVISVVFQRANQSLFGIEHRQNTSNFAVPLSTDWVCRVRSGSNKSSLRDLSRTNITWNSGL